MQFIALQTSVQADEVEIYVRKPKVGSLAINSYPTVNKTESDPSEGLQIVDAQGSLAKLYASYPAKRGDLVSCCNLIKSSSFCFIIK